MMEPQIGPSKKPTPVAISISPMFCSRSDAFEFDTTIDIEATELIPEPSPPIICAKKDQKRKAYGLFILVDNKYRPYYCRKMHMRPTIMAISRPIFCKYKPPRMVEIMKVNAFELEETTTNKDSTNTR